MVQFLATFDHLSLLVCFDSSQSLIITRCFSMVQSLGTFYYFRAILMIPAQLSGILLVIDYSRRFHLINGENAKLHKFE